MNSEQNTDRHELRRLLRERNDHPELLASIDEEISGRFTRRLAVLVLDMAGFSRLTQRYGVIHYLAMIERMQQLVLPIVEAEGSGGRLVKAEADDVVAVFETPAQAVEAAYAIQTNLVQVNEALPEDWDVHVSIGIGYGDLLLIDHDDVFGNEMNLASKLGEDIGERGEIRVTEAAYATLDEQKHPGTREEILVSGVYCIHHRLDHR